MNKSNFQHLIRQELVNRFEDVIKNEIREFERIQIHNDGAITDLRLSIKNIKESLQSLHDHVNKNSENLTEKVRSEKIDFLRIVTEQAKFLNDLFNSIEISSEEFDKIKNNTVQLKDLNEIKTNIENDIQEIKILINDNEVRLQHKLSEYVDEIKKTQKQNELNEQLNLNKINKFVNEFKETVNAFEINSQGYLKELQAYKRKALIHEKMIEDLYMQIERLKKQVEK